ncbi:MAG: sulfite exporter TauE/SafE family protein [Chloroflexota bacterium]
MLTTVFAIGAAGGLLSGMLGVGGAVILLPLLTAFAGLSLKQASGITIVQVVVSSLVSWAAYQRGRLVHLELATYMGSASALGGIAGGYGSSVLSSRTLEWVFLSVVIVAIALLLIPVGELPATSGDLPRFNPVQAIGLGLMVGALAGLLGAGGGFLIVPLMIGALRLPTRLAIGSSPVVILISGSFGFAGKLLAGQIQPDLAAALVVSAAPCAYLGTHIGRRLPSRFLRLLLGTILVLIAVRGVLVLFS